MRARGTTAIMITTASLVLTRPALADSPHQSSASAPYTMSSSTSCDAGINGTSTCTNSARMDPATGKVDTLAFISTGNDSMTVDSGEAQAEAEADASLYLRQPAASVTVTVTYEIVQTPSVAGYVAAHESNEIEVAATAACAGCQGSTQVVLDSSDGNLGTSGTPAGTVGTVHVAISNPSGADIPKGTIQVRAISVSEAGMGDGTVQQSPGRAAANADNQFLSISL